MSDALIELEALLPQIGPAVDRRRFGESLGRTADLLRDATRHLERLTALLEIARETDFAQEEAHADALSHLYEAVDGTASSMLTAANPNDLREVQEDYNDFVQELGRAETQLRRHWRAVVERDFRPLTAIGQLLRDIETTSDAGRRFIACGEAAERSGNNAGVVSAWRDAVVQLRQQRTSLEAERHTLTKNVEVDAFLDALADGRATLRHVTPGVRDWLEHNQALDGFAVRSRT
ncbi:hypothetical protein A3862_29685 (plasmid) [Methylobacterium sp. XJLW]|uniref:hypothetical protein n=1 Tax=Methylobacterium sp. XJLW TaxID=739141 RepID=UPI000DAB0816|nr:hypothetical protein [Methylobacterium sp. XJLW]AWV19815.1 hypothetical protein A3862_29685 [Methylobacterium sp. XJLW]